MIPCPTTVAICLLGVENRLEDAAAQSGLTFARASILLRCISVCGFEPCDILSHSQGPVGQVEMNERGAVIEPLHYGGENVHEGSCQGRHC